MFGRDCHAMHSSSLRRLMIFFNKPWTPNYLYLYCLDIASSHARDEAPRWSNLAQIVLAVTNTTLSSAAGLATVPASARGGDWGDRPHGV